MNLEERQNNLIKNLILGMLRTNLSPNKRNELLREYNELNNKE